MKLSVEKLKELVQNSRLDYRKQNVIGKCPRCGEDEFGISVEENHRFGCYRKKKCGFTGNIFTLLKFLGKLSNYTDSDEIYSRTEEKLVKRLEIKKEEINLHLDTITIPLGWKRTYQNEYLDSRGFRTEDYTRYIVGTTLLDPKLREDYVVFLVEENKELKGYVSRHIWDKKKIEEENKKRQELGLSKLLRYRNSDTDFSKLLGGYDELTEETEVIILVEGIFDKINVDRLLELYNQSYIKCLCTFKCHMSLEQIYKVQRFRNIRQTILLYDSDVIDEIRKVGLELEDKFQLVQIGLSKTKDPGDMNLSELEETLSYLYYPYQFATTKLAIKKLN